jgi:hypothetical protein
MAKPIFAEADYQTAFDRGVAAADALLQQIMVTGQPIPAEWPGSPADAESLVQDLFRLDQERETQRLIRVVAYCACYVRWRTLVRSR